jgi:anaerobic magnesium-protoporphyrin IX monomethyl ester cyclase
LIWLILLWFNSGPILIAKAIIKGVMTMAYFRNICLVEAPQAIISPFPRFISDCIGICYLAAAVKQDVESVSIPENYYNQDLFESFAAHLKRQPADLVGISLMTGCYNNAIRLAEIAKKHGAFVVMGGFHPTAFREEMLKSAYVDAAAIGEGEATFRELVLKGPSKEVKGLILRDNGEIVFTGNREIIKDINSIALPLRNIRPKRYGEKGDAYSIDTIFTSRGCPWSCSFCANDLMHQHWRGRSPQNVIDEIALLHDPRKKKLLKIWDANFLTNIGRVETICDMMIERGLTNFRIMTETRAKDLIRAEHILGKLRKVGLSKVGLGIESPNVNTLKLMNKKNTLDDISRAITLLQKHGIGPEGYFIIGHYTETIEDTFIYPEYAKGLGLRQSLFMCMTPYPGTKIFEEYRNEKKITSYDWDLYNNFCPVVETRHMNTATLIRMLAYCNIAFNDFRSVLKRNSRAGALIALMRDLIQVCFLMQANKDLKPEEVSNLIFEACLEFIDRNPIIEYLGKSSDKKLRKSLPIRLQHSKGKAIDFTISQKGEKRVLSLSKRFDNAPVEGPIIQLDNLVAAAASISMDALMKLLCHNELVRNNPSKMTGLIASILTDKDARAIARKLIKLYRQTVARNRSDHQAAPMQMN